MSYHSGESVYCVNFGVKTLEEEENTAGVVKANFISGTNRMIIMFPVIAIKQCQKWSMGIRRGFTVSLFRRNWYKINDYLAAKVLLQVKGILLLRFLSKTWAQGGIPDGILRPWRSTFRRPGG